VLIFLFGWALGLLTNYTNISLGQRMVLRFWAADLFRATAKAFPPFSTPARSVGDNIRRVTSDLLLYLGHS